LVFSSNINGIGWGALTQREDHKLINTDKEKVMLNPASDAFMQLAAKCVEQRVTVDLFFAMSQYKSVDLTSIAVLPSVTGGDLHFMAPFDINKHGEKLHYEIFRVLTRVSATEVQIKARVSAGMSVIEYFGGFTFKEQPDISLASIDSDKSIGFVIRVDEKLKENSLAFI
jgi:protein transport protein SEC24